MHQYLSCTSLQYIDTSLLQKFRNDLISHDFTFPILARVMGKQIIRYTKLLPSDKAMLINQLFDDRPVLSGLIDFLLLGGSQSSGFISEVFSKEVAYQFYKYGLFIDADEGQVSFSGALVPVYKHFFLTDRIRIRGENYVFPISSEQNYLLTVAGCVEEREGGGAYSIFVAEVAF